jgi:UDP-N-acetylmuramate dehydrogenase
MADGLKGMEWCVSVPGTLGGAVVNNAGAHGGDMDGNLNEISLLDLHSDATLTWERQRLAYGYRSSALKGQHGRYIVLSASLHLDPGHPPAELNAIADQFIEHRKRTQPPGASLGSMFKNPPGDFAGRLIEAAGLKGHQIGGVQVSPIHANFFVNHGTGTAADYAALIDLAQARVQAEFGIELELEVERIGDWA